MILAYNKERTVSVATIITFLFVAFAFVLCFAQDSTPLTHDYPIDYGIFRVVSNGWMHGAIPYRDLFDNKGPFLYILNIIGTSIYPGKIGVYIFESLFLFFTLILLYQLGITVTSSKRKTLFGIAFTLLIFIVTIESGGTNEEYCLPFVVYPMLVLAKFLIQKQRINYKQAMLCGICMACVSQIRLNNTAIIVAVCISIAYEFIKKKQYHELFKIVGMFTLGLLVILLPLVVYFIAHDALYDMFYISVIYNIKYKQSWGGDTTNRIIPNVARLSACIILPILSYIHDKRYNTNILTLSLPMSCLTFLTFYSGIGYFHYFTMYLPIVFLATTMVYKHHRLISILSLIVIIAPYSYKIFEFSFDNYQNKVAVNKSNALHLLQEEVFGVVPESERNSIYIIGESKLSPIFIDTDYFPVGKFFATQNAISRVDPICYYDILKHFEMSHPQWILSTSSLDDYRFLAKFYQQYSLETEKYIDGLQINLMIYRRTSTK